ncbi:MAG: 2Fe-2S iron-sulfur cluster-binding protein, partial [Pseudomonadota bacterium]
MSGYRLARGGVVDRARPLAWHFDGRGHVGLAGDTLGSAMLAAGLTTVARGFKYHRPRGVMTAGVEETGALVTLHRGARREANAKAPAVELVEGLEAFGQNAWPSVGFDLGRVNDLMGRFFAAGFYYKTFFGVTGRGTAEWMTFEWVIRRAAGMGRAADPAEVGDGGHEAYDVVHDHCDVAVVGAGPAGLAAAEAAAAAGLDTVLIEQDFETGGSLIGRGDAVEGQGGADWLAARRAALASAGVRVLVRTTAFGLYDTNVLGLYQRAPGEHATPEGPRGALRILRPARVILATGALERPIVCGDNDRPGVMLAGAVERYANRFAVAPGSRAVIATAEDAAYDTALALAGAGVEVTLADARRAPSAHREAAEAAGVSVMQGYVPVAVRGLNAVRGVALGRVPGGGLDAGHGAQSRAVEADVERIV